MSEATARSTSGTILSFTARLVLFLVFIPPAFLITVSSSLLCFCGIPTILDSDSTVREAFSCCFGISRAGLMVSVGVILILPFLPFLGIILYCMPKFQDEEDDVNQIDILEIDATITTQPRNDFILSDDESACDAIL